MKTEKGTRAVIFLVSAILLLNILAPAVSAKGPRSGRIVQQEVTLEVTPDDSLNWTQKLNLANGSDYQYLDYNFSWIPFFENHTDLQGILISPSLVSPLYELNVTNQTISTGSFFKLIPSQIMDGASEIWWRLPITDIPLNATISQRIWRVTNIPTFNMSWSGFKSPSFDQPQNLEIVYNITLDPNADVTTPDTETTIPDGWINYTEWQNVSLTGTATTYWYNYTYVKSCFMLFPNEWYFTEFDIYAPFADEMKMIVSLNDIGDDSIYNGWFWVNGTSYYVPVDLDTAMLLTYGASNGITGIGTRDSYVGGSGVRLWYFNSSIPIDETVDSGSKPWFEIVIPVLANMSGLSVLGIEMYVHFYSSQDDSTCILTSPLILRTFNTTYAFLLADINVTTINGQYVDHIRCEMYTLYNTGTHLKFWGTQIGTKFSSQTGFTDIYYTADSGGIRTWRCYEKQWVVPFGYYGFSSSYWNQTNTSLIVIPVNTPKTALGLVISLFGFRAYLHRNETINNEGDWLNTREEWLWDVTKNGVGDFFNWMKNQYVKNAIKAAFWAIEHIPGLKSFLLFVVDALRFIAGIGLWLWEKINLLIDALEWFTYWAVRMVYSLSIAIVYIVNVFGIISINSALLNVSRTGNGRDFVRAFQTGWRFVFAIISLLLSLAIMAITIVSAVVPF